MAGPPRDDARRLPDFDWNVLCPALCNTLLGRSRRMGNGDRRLVFHADDASGVKSRPEAGGDEVVRRALVAAEDTSGRQREDFHGPQGALDPG